MPREGTSLSQAPATLRLRAPAPAVLARRLGGRLAWHRSLGRGPTPTARGTLLGNAPDRAAAPIPPAPFLLLSHSREQFLFCFFFFLKVHAEEKVDFHRLCKAKVGLCLREAGKHWHGNAHDTVTQLTALSPPAAALPPHPRKEKRSGCASQAGHLLQPGFCLKFAATLKGTRVLTQIRFSSSPSPRAVTTRHDLSFRRRAGEPSGPSPLPDFLGGSGLRPAALARVPCPEPLCRTAAKPNPQFKSLSKP